MKNDEHAISQWFARWMNATKEGDLQLARSLIADDAVFLVPGADQMDKESFAAAATADEPNIAFELDCSIQETQLMEEHPEVSRWVRGAAKPRVNYVPDGLVACAARGL